MKESIYPKGETEKDMPWKVFCKYVSIVWLNIGAGVWLNILQEPLENLITIIYQSSIQKHMTFSNRKKDGTVYFWNLNF